MYYILLFSIPYYISSSNYFCIFACRNAGCNNWQKARMESLHDCSKIACAKVQKIIQWQKRKVE